MNLNFVHPYDILRLFDKIRESGFAKNIFRIFSNEDDRVRTTWNHSSSNARSWLDITAVQKRINKKISGDESMDHFEYVSKKYFSDGKKRIALSIGCGAGGRELRWAQTGKFSRIDAYDLSPSRILIAQQKSKDQHLDSILNFAIGDVRSLSNLNDKYDVVIAEGILHHLSPLNEMLQKIKTFLKFDGMLIVNEYVGPTRFQWSDKQMEEVNKLLSSLPEKYKMYQNNVSRKRNIHRPGLLTMYLYDPSEAVESANILPLLNNHFKIIERKEYGGHLLQLLFKDIAHHFSEPDAATQEILMNSFSREDELLAKRTLESDFMFILGSPK